MVSTLEDLRTRISELKKQRNAVILAHNYQLPDVQDIANFVGDSLGLSQQAAATDADVIVFCGVHFMAETAAILAPDRTVLIPDLDAGCSLDRKSTRLNSSHPSISYAVFCLKKKIQTPLS